MLNAQCVPKWADIQYGVPKPRFVKPLVRINGMVEDMSQGYRIDPCYMPPTILQLDECSLLLRVNDALLDMRPLLPCLPVASGAGAPAAPPGAGYLPLYLDQITKKLYVHAGGVWVITS